METLIKNYKPEIRNIVQVSSNKISQGNVYLLTISKSDLIILISQITTNYLVQSFVSDNFNKKISIELINNIITINIHKTKTFGIQSVSWNLDQPYITSFINYEYKNTTQFPRSLNNVLTNEYLWSINSNIYKFKRNITFNQEVNNGLDILFLQYYGFYNPIYASLFRQKLIGNPLAIQTNINSFSIYSTQECTNKSITFNYRNFFQFL